MSALYLQHFGLCKQPFQITPDLGFFFAGGQRGDILSALLHVAGHEEGIITLIAEVGSGKTLLARLMISRLGADICTVYLANPTFSRDEILAVIGRDLGLIDLPASTEARLAALQQELLRRHSIGQRVLLVIDEAHAMPPESLEEVRLLSNLETGQHKLLNIMLFGQPELEEVLADRRLRQVRDRVVHRFQLKPLPPEEAGAYIDHRLRAAGWAGGALFSPQAMALLVKASGGRARRINLLADKALLAAFALGLKDVGRKQVQEAISELHDDFSVRPAIGIPRWIPWLALTIVLAAGMATLALWIREKQSGSAVSLTETTSSTSVTIAPTPIQSASGFATLAAPAPMPKAASDKVVPMESLQTYLDRTTEFLSRQNLAGYSVQLASLPREASAVDYLNFVSHHVDSSMVFAQLSHYNGRSYVSVFVGHFGTAAEANAALAQWPHEIKKNKPMLRTWVKIGQDHSS